MKKYYVIKIERKGWTNLKINEILKESPIIAAANDENLKEAVDSNASAVILMEGKLSNLIEENFKSYIDKKNIFIHMDLLKGLSNDLEGIKFLKENIKVKGIVSTKSSTLRAAKKQGLLTIQRIFLIDTKSLKNAIKSVKENKPDAVEVMPALSNSIIQHIKEEIKRPVILGGLINSKEDILGALNAGADGVSFSKSHLWNMDIEE